MKKILLFPVFPLFVLALYFVSSCNRKDENQVSASIIEDGCSNKGVTATTGAYQLFAPNVFTPNQDGINDYFAVYISFTDSTNYEGNLSVTITHNDFGTVHTYQLSMSDSDHNWGQYKLAVWDGENSNNEIVTGIYQYEISGAINGSSFTYSGELTLINERTFLEYCQKCEPLDSGDPAIDCAD